MNCIVAMCLKEWRGTTRSSSFLGVQAGLLQSMMSLTVRGQKNGRRKLLVFGDVVQRRVSLDEIKICGDSGISVVTGPSRADRIIGELSRTRISLNYLKLRPFYQTLSKSMTPTSATAAPKASGSRLMHAATSVPPLDAPFIATFPGPAILWSTRYLLMQWWVLRKRSHRSWEKALTLQQ